jgi:hypothetical protein
MAQGGGHPTIAIDRGKQLRFQEQLLFELLGVFRGERRLALAGCLFVRVPPRLSA